MRIQDVRLNGSAASYIADDPSASDDLYNDLDFLFLLDENVDQNIHALFENIRVAFFECLFDRLPFKPALQSPSNFNI